MDLGLGLALVRRRAVSGQGAGGADFLISDQASFDAFMASASSGQVGEVTASGLTLSRATARDLSGVTLRTASGVTVYQMSLTDIHGITLDGFSVANANIAVVDPDAAESANSMLIFSGCDNVTLTNSSFSGARGDNDYEKFQNAIYIADCLNFSVANNSFDSVYRAVLAQANGDGTLGNACRFVQNTVRNFVGQAWRVAWSDFVAQGNDIRGCVSRSGRRLVGVITGTLNVGDSISLDNAGTQGGQIQAVGAGYVDIKYNSHEKPVATGSYQVRGNTSNFITVTSITTDYDPSHSDIGQAILNSATRDCILKVQQEISSRLDANGLVDFPSISADNGCPGHRVQSNGSSYRWIDVEIDQNIYVLDTTEPLEVDGLSERNGTLPSLRNNLALYSSKNNGAARIRVGSNCSEVNAAGNISHAIAGTGIVDSGVNTEITGGADKGPSDYATDFPSFDREMVGGAHVLSDFAPASDLSGAGPLTIAGEYRTLAAQTEIPVVVDTTPTAFSGSGTSISSLYTAKAGSNRKVIVEVNVFDAGGVATITADIGGQAMTALPAFNHVGGFESVQVFELAEADIPIGEQTITVTAASSMTAIGAVAMTAKNISQAAPVLSAGEVGANALSEDINPAAAGSLVIGQAWNSSPNGALAWTAGLSDLGTPLTIESTAEMLIGVKNNCDAASMTGTFTGGVQRYTAMLSAFEPA